MDWLYRFIGVVFWLKLFFIRAWIIKCCTKDPVRQRQKLSWNTTYISRGLLKPFGLKVHIANPEKLQVLNSENHLIVSNHVSYTDILIMASCRPFVFITSTDMAASPFLGDITRLGGSLFTNRKKHTTLPEEINNFSNALKQGFNLVLFPEGTSTNGETIRDFRKSLFQTSITAQKPLLPICIKYKTLDGGLIETQAQRDIVCWYGDMSFVPHFFKLLKHQVEIEVTVLDPIPFDPSVKRQQLCDTVHKLLIATYHS